MWTFSIPYLLLGRSTEAQSYHSSDKHSSRGKDNRDSQLPAGWNWTRLSVRGSLIWTLPHGRHHPHTKRWRLSSGQFRLHLRQDVFWAHNCSSSCTYNWLLYCRVSFHPPSVSERRLRSDVVDQVRNATSMCCWLVRKQHLQDLGDLLLREHSLRMSYIAAEVDAESTCARLHFHPTNHRVFPSSGKHTTPALSVSSASCWLHGAGYVEG